jgi:hypothetical protein
MEGGGGGHRLISCSAFYARAAGCHENRPTKRRIFFERKKTAKWNVATRQPVRFVGPVLKDDFEFELYNSMILSENIDGLFLRNRLPFAFVPYL